MEKLELPPTCSTAGLAEHVGGREDWAFQEIIAEDFLELIKDKDL